jgi:Rho-binding antiterminator
MPDYQPIACVEHERLEFAVLRRIPLSVLLKDGRTLQGQALDVYTKEGAEWLDLCDALGKHHTLRLDELAQVREITGQVHPDTN